MFCWNMQAWVVSFGLFILVAVHDFSLATWLIVICCLYLSSFIPAEHIAIYTNALAFFLCVELYEVFLEVLDVLHLTVQLAVFELFDNNRKMK